MSKKGKTIFSILLIVILLLNLCMMSAGAEESDTAYVGTDTISADETITDTDKDSVIAPSGEDDYDFFFYREGDADDDFTIDSVDVTMIQRFCAGLRTEADRYFTLRSDVDWDGEVDIVDATLIQRYLCEMEMPYNIGGYVEYYLGNE